MGNIGYSELDKMDWSEVKESLSEEYRLPYSVHVPLNFPASVGLTYCDCALNAYYLPSPPLNSSLRADRLMRDLIRLRMVSFAFGEQPFVPDFRHVAMSRRVGGLPIIRGEFTAWNYVCETDYCLSPDGVVHIRMKVRNEQPARRKAVVWVRPSMPRESRMFDYHYVPFSWGAKNWLPDESYVFYEGRFYTDKGLVGQVEPGAFAAEWIEKQSFLGEGVNRMFCCATPYYAMPAQQLAEVERALRLEVELDFNESATFEIAIRLDDVLPSPAQLSVGYAEAESSAVAAWRGILSGMPVVDLGSRRENDVVEAVRLTNLQLLLDVGKGLRPCQGGSTERFYVWVWEAMCSLRPMLKLGHFELVRRVIEFIFGLQDGGCPPVGEFSSLKGAIGTSGPKWANSTGAALSLASDYIQYSGDKSFIDEYLPKMMAAAQWIIGELHETRKKTDDTRGIMPPCRSTDGDCGQVIFTDSWTLAGLKSFGLMLQSLGHSEAGRILGEAAQYKEDLDAVLDAYRKPDGFIPRAYGDVSGVCHGFRYTCTVMECCAAHVSSATEERMEGYLNWMVSHACQGVFFSEVSHGIYYIGNNELTAMKMFMALNRPKAAWAAGRAFRRFVVTPDVYMAQERFSTLDSGFTAWQPNASNGGRLLEMQLSRFFYEDVLGRLILFGAFSPDELRRNPSVKGVWTSFGKTDVSCMDGTVKLVTERPMPCGTVLVVCGKTVTLERETTEWNASLN